MAALGELQASINVINLFDVFTRYNHHYTQVGLVAEILGEDLPANDEIFYTFLQGQHTSQYPAWYQQLTTKTCTGGSSNTITTTGMVAGAYDGMIIEITSGTGLNQRKKILSNTSTTITLESFWSFGYVPTNGSSNFRIVTGAAMYHLRTDFANKPVNFYLPHDHYTFWIMVYDNGGNPKVARAYINTNELLSNATGLKNTDSPQIIGHTTTNTANSTVTVQAKKGETVRIYWESQMSNTDLSALWPSLQDGFVYLGDQLHEVRRGTPYSNTPLASGVVSAENGQITLTIPNSALPQFGGSPLHDIRVVASATAGTGYGQSFMTAPCFIKWPKTGTGGKVDARQSKFILTATSSTGVVDDDNKPARLYTIEAKQYDSENGAITTPNQGFYKYSKNNDDNEANYTSISSGVWLPIGLTTNLIFKHEEAGYETTWWGTSTEVSGTTAAVLTPFTSLDDAWVRGQSPTLVKETKTWYSVAFAVGNKVYLNNDPTDNSVAGDGFYWIQAQGVGITISGGQGVISARQTPQY